MQTIKRWIRNLIEWAFEGEIPVKAKIKGSDLHISVERGKRNFR